MKINMSCVIGLHKGQWNCQFFDIRDCLEDNTEILKKVVVTLLLASFS